MFDFGSVGYVFDAPLKMCIFDVCRFYRYLSLEFGPHENFNLLLEAKSLVAM